MSSKCLTVFGGSGVKCIAAEGTKFRVAVRHGIGNDRVFPNLFAGSLSAMEPHIAEIGYGQAFYASPAS